MEPFDIGFNAMVMKMANRTNPTGWDVLENGSPTSLVELQDYVHAHGRIPVDANNSDETIFGCREHNYAFRAWHDWTHIQIHADFTIDGELAVAHRQIEDMHRLYGHGKASQVYALLIMSEVYGQARYYAENDTLPVNQRQFTRGYLGRHVNLAWSAWRTTLKPGEF